MDKEIHIKELEGINAEYSHAKNILAKQKNFQKLTLNQQHALGNILPKYFIFLNENLRLIGYSEKVIKKRVSLLNDYYQYLDINNYDNIFTSQGKFRPTILEEFMFILFRDFVNEVKNKIEDKNNLLKLGHSKSYTNLYFSAKNLHDFVSENLQININNKDQDFTIFRPIEIGINNKIINLNVPVIAIENKTYIDKTMLEGSIATAEKIKSGNPYSKFYVVTETYEVDLKVDPVYSRIDQIFVLRKSNNSNLRKTTNNKIYEDVVLNLFNVVQNHLERDWSNIENKMKNTGTII